MTDTLPDRLSTNPKSPYFNAAILERDVGVRFSGVEKNNVEEYCVSEGWIRVAAGSAKDRAGNGQVKRRGRALLQGCQARVTFVRAHGLCGP